MEIAELVNRFRHYAENHVALKHVEGERMKAFIHLDIEEFQESLINGMKFPCMLLQTPGVEKSGGYDNRSEGFDFTFVVLCQDRLKLKPQLLTEAKKITDAIFNRFSADAVEFDYGEIVGTDEGLFGPLSGNVYGWAVSTTVVDPVDGEVKPAEWLDLNGGEP